MNQSATCPDCREYETHRKANHPYAKNKVLALDVGMMATVIILLVLKSVLYFLPAPVSAEATELMKTFTTTFTVAGAIVMIAVMLSWSLFRMFLYGRHNAKGYRVYAYLTKSGEVHQHLAIHEVNAPAATIMDYYVCGGEFDCQITTPHGVIRAVNVQVRNMGADELYIVKGGGELHTKRIEAVLHLVASGCDLEEVAECVLPRYKEMLTTLLFLALVTQKPDPAGLGESKHGQFVHEQVSKLRAVREAVQDDRYSPVFRAATTLVDDLLDERDIRRPPGYIQGLIDRLTRELL